LFTVKDQACDGVRRLGIRRLQDVLVQVHEMKDQFSGLTACPH